ncbi:MAG: phospholipid carrier-dependent glycosyltransferase [Nanoarchaeota archaeon]|nr:phospholipid carrier-dependent glycosyltransferase [Nanoarchaeota archaeon]
MHKKEVVFIIFLVVLAVSIRSLTMSKENFIGADSYYHYTVVELGLEQGRLSNHNPLDMCPDGHTGGHPVGFYAIPYYLSFILGLPIAFGMTPALMGALTVVLVYFLTKLWFDRRTAIISSLLMAVSNAHLSRSTALYYRGDNLVYPFLLAGLLFLTMSFRAKDRKAWLYAALAGIASGLSSLMWNGHIIVMVAFGVSVMAYLFYSYMFKGRGQLKIILALAAQAATILLVHAAIGITHNAARFHFTYYLPIILPLLAIAALFIHFTKSWSRKTKLLSLGVAVLALVVVAIIFWGKTKLLLTGFGSVRPIGDLKLIQELRPFDFRSFWLNYWVAVFFMPAGLFLYFRHLNRERVMLLGLLLPFSYMMANSLRYMFLASVPFMIVTAICLRYLFRSKSKLLFTVIITPLAILAFFVFIVLPMSLIIIPLLVLIIYLARKWKKQWWLIFGLVLLLGTYTVYMKTTFFIPTYDEGYEKAFNDLDGIVPQDACFTGKMIRLSLIQMFMHRPTYFSSVAMNQERKRETYTFLMSNQTYPMKVPGLYFFNREEDGNFVWSYNELANEKGLFGSPFLYPINHSEKIGHNETEYMDLIDRKRFVVRQYPSGIAGYYRKDDQLIPIYMVYYDGVIYRREDNVTSPQTGCLYLGNQYRFYYNEKLCNTNLAKMLMGLNITGMERVYFQDGVSVYKLSENVSQDSS